MHRTRASSPPLSPPAPSYIGVPTSNPAIDDATVVPRGGFPTYRRLKPLPKRRRTSLGGTQAPLERAGSSSGGPIPSISLLDAGQTSQQGSDHRSSANFLPQVPLNLSHTLVSIHRYQQQLRYQDRPGVVFPSDRTNQLLSEMLPPISSLSQLSSLPPLSSLRSRLALENYYLPMLTSMFPPLGSGSGTSINPFALGLDSGLPMPTDFINAVAAAASETFLGAEGVTNGVAQNREEELFENGQRNTGIINDPPSKTRVGKPLGIPGNAESVILPVKNDEDNTQSPNSVPTGDAESSTRPPHLPSSTLPLSMRNFDFRNLPPLPSTQTDFVSVLNDLEHAASSLELSLLRHGILPPLTPSGRVGPRYHARTGQINQADGCESGAGSSSILPSTVNSSPQVFQHLVQSATASETLPVTSDLFGERGDEDILTDSEGPHVPTLSPSLPLTTAKKQDKGHRRTRTGRRISMSATHTTEAGTATLSNTNEIRYPVTYEFDLRDPNRRFAYIRDHRDGSSCQAPGATPKSYGFSNQPDKYNDLCRQMSGTTKKRKVPLASLSHSRSNSPSIHKSDGDEGNADDVNDLEDDFAGDYSYAPYASHQYGPRSRSRSPLQTPSDQSPGPILVRRRHVFIKRANPVPGPQEEKPQQSYVIPPLSPQHSNQAQPQPQSQRLLQTSTYDPHTHHSSYPYTTQPQSQPQTHFQLQSAQTRMQTTRSPSTSRSASPQRPFSTPHCNTYFGTQTQLHPQTPLCLPTPQQQQHIFSFSSVLSPLTQHQGAPFTFTSSHRGIEGESAPKKHRYTYESSDHLAAPRKDDEYSLIYPRRANAYQPSSHPLVRSRSGSPSLHRGRTRLKTGGENGVYTPPRSPPSLRNHSRSISPSQPHIPCSSRNYFDRQRYYAPQGEQGGVSHGWAGTALGRVVRPSHSVPPLTRGSASTLTGLSFKEMVKSRKRQLAGVLGTATASAAAGLSIGLTVRGAVEKAEAQDVTSKTAGTVPISSLSVETETTSSRIKAAGATPPTYSNFNSEVERIAAALAMDQALASLTRWEWGFSLSGGYDSAAASAGLPIGPVSGTSAARQAKSQHPIKHDFERGSQVQDNGGDGECPTVGMTSTISATVLGLKFPTPVPAIVGAASSTIPSRSSTPTTPPTMTLPSTIDLSSVESWKTDSSTLAKMAHLGMKIRPSRRREDGLLEKSVNQVILGEIPSPASWLGVEDEWFDEDEAYLEQQQARGIDITTLHARPRIWTGTRMGLQFKLNGDLPSAWKEIITPEEREAREQEERDREVRERETREKALAKVNIRMRGLGNAKKKKKKKKREAVALAAAGAVIDSLEEKVVQPVTIELWWGATGLQADGPLDILALTNETDQEAADASAKGGLINQAALDAANAPEVPFGEFEFTHESLTSERLRATYRQLSILRNRFIAELARQATKVAADAQRKLELEKEREKERVRGRAREKARAREREKLEREKEKHRISVGSEWAQSTNETMTAALNITSPSKRKGKAGAAQGQVTNVVSTPPETQIMLQASPGKPRSTKKRKARTSLGGGSLGNASEMPSSQYDVLIGNDNEIPAEDFMVNAKVNEPNAAVINTDANVGNEILVTPPVALVQRPRAPSPSLQGVSVIWQQNQQLQSAPQVPRQEQDPTSLLGLKPSSNKKKKKKRSALANASNPHHLRNYVPSRLPHSSSSTSSLTLNNFPFPAGVQPSVNVNAAGNADHFGSGVGGSIPMGAPQVAWKQQQQQQWIQQQQQAQKDWLSPLPLRFLLAELPLPAPQIQAHAQDQFTGQQQQQQKQRISSYHQAPSQTSGNQSQVYGNGAYIPTPPPLAPLPPVPTLQTSSVVNIHPDAEPNIALTAPITTGGSKKKKKKGVVAIDHSRSLASTSASSRFYTVTGGTSSVHSAPIQPSSTSLSTQGVPVSMLAPVPLTNPLDEWVCPYCEYDLFYAGEGNFRRAIKNRKKILKRRRRARERAAAAASGVGAGLMRGGNAAPTAQAPHQAPQHQQRGPSVQTAQSYGQGSPNINMNMSATDGHQAMPNRIPSGQNLEYIQDYDEEEYEEELGEGEGEELTGVYDNDVGW